MIGTVLAVSYAAAGAMSFGHIYAARRFGGVKPVVWMQLIGAVCVLALPWTPWFWLATLLNAGAGFQPGHPRKPLVRLDP
ncbi:hypothetical protein LJK88_40690 [Paenibacillus sp. P26]|nr:hypothetical protein LJK88_40690 [Paenibacillus sp. P26]